jgi:hypothetical protein
MPKILFTILWLISPIGCLAQEAMITQSAQRAIETAQFHQNLIIIFLFLSFFANLIITIANYLIENQPEIHPLRAIYITLFGKDKGRSKFKIVNTKLKQIPLAKLSVISATDKIIFSKYTDLRGEIAINPFEKCSIIIESFGYAKRIVKPGQISRDNFIILKPQEDISTNYANLATKHFGKILLILSVALGLYLSRATLEYYPHIISLLIISLTVINTLVISRSIDRFITVFDHQDKLLTHQSLSIADSKKIKMNEVKTDSKGRIRAIFAPGFYRISKPNSISKILEIKKQKPFYIKFKLN